MSTENAHKQGRPQRRPRHHGLQHHGLQGCVGRVGPLPGSARLTVEWTCGGEDRRSAEVTLRSEVFPPPQRLHLDATSPRQSFELGSGPASAKGEVGLRFHQDCVELHLKARTGASWVFDETLGRWSEHGDEPICPIDPCDPCPPWEPADPDAPCGPPPEIAGCTGVEISGPLETRPLVSFLWSRPPRPLPPDPPPIDVVVCPDPRSLRLFQELEQAKAQGKGPADFRALGRDFEQGKEFVATPDALEPPSDRLGEILGRIAALPGERSLEELLALAAQILCPAPARKARPEDSADEDSGDEDSADEDSGDEDAGDDSEAPESTPRSCVRDYLETQGAGAADRLWQSLFAELLILPVTEAPAELAVTSLRSLHLLELLVIGDTSLEHEGPRRRAVEATVAVPELIAYATAESVKATGGAPGWVGRFWVGILQWIRHRVEGYRAGEIAGTINLLAGEKKVLSHRRTTRRQERLTEDTDERHDSRDSEDTDERSGFEQTVQDLLTHEARCRDFNNLTQKYGPNCTTFTLDGKVEETGGGERAGGESASAYARDLIRRAAYRLSTRVRRRRSRTWSEEQERLERSSFDNRQGARPRVGLYRWLEEVVRFHLEERGRRLVVELLLSDPAATYLHEVQCDVGVPLDPPVAPGDLDPPVTGPDSITAQSYLSLAAVYGLDDVPPPPTESRTVAAVFQSLAGHTDGFVDIPPGYVVAETSSAQVSWSIGSGDYGLAGTLGPGSFSSKGTGAGNGDEGDGDEGDGDRGDGDQGTEDDGKGNGGNGGCQIPTPPVLEAAGRFPEPVGQSADLSQKLAGLGGRLPVGVVCAAESWTVTVELLCELVNEADAFKAWQQTVYDRLLRTYEVELGAYRKALRDRIRTTSTGHFREIERRGLESQGLQALWAYHEAAASDGSSEPTPTSPDPAYLRFFTQAFEWPEITYTFHPFGVGPRTELGLVRRGELLADPCSDELFQAFLTAGSARVLVPVAPGLEPAVLFFLLFGDLWPGPVGMAPVTIGALGLLADLADVCDNNLSHPDHRARCPRSWSAVLPTSHVVLESDTGWCPDRGATGPANPPDPSRRS